MVEGYVRAKKEKANRMQHGGSFFMASTCASTTLLAPFPIQAVHEIRFGARQLQIHPLEPAGGQPRRKLGDAGVEAHHHHGSAAHGEAHEVFRKRAFVGLCREHRYEMRLLRPQAVGQGRAHVVPVAVQGVTSPETRQRTGARPAGSL